MTAQVFTAIGLMSGTSLDGVDAALLRTDGHHLIETGPSLTVPYSDEARQIIRAAFGKKTDYAAAEQIVTDFHIQAVRQFLADNRIAPEQIDLIGFHGQTLLHAPHENFTLQIGNGQRLADETGIDVVCDFRSSDVAAGGHGAPLVPLYHQALAHNLPKPLAILNIGGVANVTWLGSNGDILAFDTGPGNALIDDCVLELTGQNYDEDGRHAAQGAIDHDFINRCLAHEFFQVPPPKSLDRDQFQMLRDHVKHQNAHDRIATITHLTAATITAALDHFPERPHHWLVCGGGRHNKTLMISLQALLNAPVDPVECSDWCGDSLEAQAFAYLAVRAKLGLPLTSPQTTGAPQPLTGGKYHAANRVSI